MRVEIERATSGEPKLDGMYIANLVSDGGALIEWGFGVTIRVALDNLHSCVEDAEMDNLAWVEEAKAFLDGAAHG